MSDLKPNIACLPSDAESKLKLDMHVHVYKCTCLLYMVMLLLFDSRNSKISYLISSVAFHLFKSVLFVFNFCSSIVSIAVDFKVFSYYGLIKTRAYFNFLKKI